MTTHPTLAPRTAAVALAQAMAEAGYADPDPIEQWRLPDVEPVLRHLRERGFTVAEAAPDAALRELLIENTDALVGWIRESGDEARARHIVEELDAALAREPQP